MHEEDHVKLGNLKFNIRIQKIYQIPTFIRCLRLFSRVNRILCISFYLLEFRVYFDILFYFILQKLQQSIKNQTIYRPKEKLRVY